MGGAAPVPQNGDAVEPRASLAEQFKGCGGSVRRQQDQPRDVVAATADEHVEEEVRTIRVGGGSNHDWDYARYLLGCASGPAAARHDDGNPETYKRGRRLCQRGAFLLHLPVVENQI